MKERSFDEMIAYFNRRVSEIDIAQDYKMELLGMVTALGYKHEKTAQQWIPCSERLPERADNVIICYKAGDYTLVSTGRYLYKFKMWYVDVVGDLRDGVTAWMPLPEPYRGGET